MYTYLGAPETENIRTRDGQPPGPHAPAILVAPIQNSKMSNAELLQESIVAGDFGRSYIVASPPSSYEPGTVLNYQPPEARFEGRVGFEADIWHSSDARFLRSARALPSSNRSWGAMSTFSGRQLRRLGDYSSLGGVLSNSGRYGSKRAGSRRASRTKDAPA